VLCLIANVGCGGDPEIIGVSEEASACGAMRAEAGTWQELPDPPLAPNPSYSTSAWTGEDFIIFDNSSYARFRPATNEWLPVSKAGAPTDFMAASVIAVDGDLLVLGVVECDESESGCPLGALYHPREDFWEPFAVEAPRVFWVGATVWSGDALYTWGAWDFDESGMRQVRLNEGGRLDWATRTWQELPVENSPAGDGLSIWTGSKLVKWGGVTRDQLLVDAGAVFDPLEWKWQLMAPAPLEARFGDAAAWTGTELLTWGGSSHVEYFGDGAAYDPETDTWRLVGESGAPSGRAAHVGEWTGTSLIVWGGIAEGREACANGGLFTPGSEAWEPIASPPWLHGRFESQAAWTGSELLVWGGRMPMDVAPGQAGVPGGGRWTPN
jgi:hypothetical protein